MVVSPIYNKISFWVISCEHLNVSNAGRATLAQSQTTCGLQPLPIMRTSESTGQWDTTWPVRNENDSIAERSRTSLRPMWRFRIERNSREQL